MADSYVCSGATMRCSMGTSQAKLTVLPNRTVYLTGQPMANISDHQSFVNLGAFGRCRSLGFPATASATAAAHGKLTPMPCVHNTPVPWMGGKNDYIVKGDPALLKSSTCQCMWGGTISITDDGQHGEGTQWIQKLEKNSFTQYQAKEDDYYGTVIEKGLISDVLDGKFEKYNDVWQQRIAEKAAANFEHGMHIVKSITKAEHDAAFYFSRNKEKYMSDDAADLSNSNPQYDKSKDYQTNCPVAVITFMLRKQGYDVSARGRSANENTLSLGKNPYQAWQDPNGNPLKKTLTKEKLISNVKKEVEKKEKTLKQEKNYILKPYASLYKDTITEACQEEGYYLFNLTWKDGTHHSTVLKSEKNKNGNTVLSHIEPQSGKSYTNIDDLFKKLAPLDKTSENDGVMRIMALDNGDHSNDLRFDVNYTDIVNINRK